VKTTFLILLFLISSMCLAQQLPRHVEFEELGLAFDIPDGWIGQLDEEAVVLGSNTLPGLMILMENTSRSAKVLKSLAMQGITDDGVMLNPVGDFKLIGSRRVEGMYEGLFNGIQVKCFAIGLINGLGSGMNILMITEKSKFTDRHISDAQKLAASVRFFQARDSAQTTAWKKEIVGNRLVYNSSKSDSDPGGGSSNFSKVIDIDLCSGGDFYWYYESVISVSAGDGMGAVVGSAGGHNTEDTQGKYNIYSDDEGSYLVLTFENGNVKESELGRNSDGFILMNGFRYLRDNLQNCS